MGTSAVAAAPAEWCAGADSTNDTRVAGNGRSDGTRTEFPAPNTRCAETRVSFPYSRAGARKQHPISAADADRMFGPPTEPEGLDTVVIYLLVQRLLPWLDAHGLGFLGVLTSVRYRAMLSVPISLTLVLALGPRVIAALR